MKKRKSKSLVKFIASLLVLSLSVTVLQPLSVFAIQDVSEPQVTLEEWDHDSEDLKFQNTSGDLTAEQLKTAELAPEDTPEIVSAEDIESKGHVNRLWEQESDLNTIIFQNRDGSKTAYHYSDPVKYTDKDGKIKDKKNKLSETSNGDYTNAENDINAYFPKKIHKNKGVQMTFGEHTVEMSPNINGNSGACRQTGHDKNSNPTDYVEYPDVFEEGVSVRYTTTFGGYKEDIILNENVGVNRFEFKLTTNGLSLICKEDGAYYLADPLTGECVVALGEVVVYDSTGIESEGYNHRYEVMALTPDEQYLVTVIVDTRYLESAETVYPVYVDPTLEVMPKGYVEDATLYSSSSERSTSGQIKIGHDAAYGTGRGLYNFPIMNFERDFILMYGNQITSATLHMYALPYGNESLYDDAKTLSLYEYESEWSSSTVKWNNTDPNNYGALFSSISVTSGWTEFDITPVIAGYKTNNNYASPFYGLLLKADDESYTTWKKFVSSYSTSNSNLRPYITITYNNNAAACELVVSGDTYYLKSQNGSYLGVYGNGTANNTGLITNDFNGSAGQQFKVTNVVGGEYEIVPQHTDGKVLTVNSSGQVVIADDCDSSSQRWYIYYRNGSYHIVNKLYSSGVMSPTYDSNFVSVNSNYQYCCWELKKLCGNSNYRDVTKHNMNFQNDCYYVCSNCGYRVKSPALQDKDILSDEDYYKVLSCYLSIPYYSEIDRENEGNYSIKATALRLIIDDIRSKNQYSQMYEYVGSDGLYEREYTVGNENDNYYMPVTINYNVIDNGLELMLNNGVAEGIVELFIGWAIPSQYQFLFFDLADGYTNVMDFLCGLAEEEGFEEISAILNLTLFVSSISEMAVTDKVVEIQFTVGSGVYESKTVFDSNGKFKFQEHST